DDLEYAVTVDAGVVEIGGTRIRLVRNTDLNMDALVDTSRINTGVDLEQSDALDAELAEFLSEMRLIKDDHELSELRGSVESTKSEEHTSELQSRFDLVCRLLLGKKTYIQHVGWIGRAAAR